MRTQTEEKDGHKRARIRRWKTVPVEREAIIFQVRCGARGDWWRIG